jgi:hypothetical protein
MRPVSFSFDAWDMTVTSVLGLCMALTLVGVILVIRELARSTRAGQRNRQLNLVAFLYALGGIFSAGLSPVVMLWSGAFDQDNAVPPIGFFLVAGISGVWAWRVFSSGADAKSL